MSGADGGNLKHQRLLKLATLLALAAGIGLFIFLLVRYGAGEVMAAVAAAGWGLLGVSAYRFVTIATDALGWRALFTGPTRLAFGSLLRLRWIAESMNSLLPVGQMGGDVARARLTTRLGVPGAEAAASVVADFTLGLVTQILYTLLGIVLLFQVEGRSAQARSFFYGLLLVALAVFGFYLVQRLGLFHKLVRVLRGLMGGKAWSSLAGGAATLDRSIATVYARRGSVLAGGAWRFTTWMLHTGETWLALYALGAPVSFAKALILESLITAVRSVAFAIPAGLGVQEGGSVLLGSGLGLTPEISLALALVKRVRELLVGGPGLIAWTTMEGRSLARLLSKRP